MATYINLYGFVEDTVFLKDLRFSLNNNEDQGVGYINSILIDYFVNIAKLKDTRDTRLAILNTTPITIGNMSIVFDNATIEQPDIWTSLTDTQYHTLFNIAETLYLTQDMENANMETLLNSDIAYNSLYVPNSFIRSTTNSEIDITNPQNATVYIPNTIYFSMYLSDDHATILNVKLWLKGTDFGTNYPYTTITSIIPPCEPSVLFNSTKTLSQMETTIDNGVFSFSKINTELVTNDQTGCLTFYTRYHISDSTEYVIPFGVVYKGPKQPTTMACRAAIKQYLIDTGLTTTDNLQTWFPELFVNYQFYIIPLWDYKQVLEDRTVYPGIGPTYAYIKQEINRLYTNYSDDYIDSRVETILNSESDILSLVIPDTLNTDTSTLCTLYPTFNRYSSSNISYSYMETYAQMLASKLAKVFAVFNKTLTTTEFNTVVIDDKTYLSFTVNSTEIIVLSPDSYTTTTE